MSGSVTDAEMRPDYFFRGLKKVIGKLCNHDYTKIYIFLGSQLDYSRVFNKHPGHSNFS